MRYGGAGGHGGWRMMCTSFAGEATVNVPGVREPVALPSPAAGGRQTVRLPRSALVRAWTDGRDEWRAQLAAAATPADLARSIRRLFRFTKWSVLDDDWDTLAPGWRAELEGYRTP